MESHRGISAVTLQLQPLLFFSFFSLSISDLYLAHVKNQLIPKAMPD